MQESIKDIQRTVGTTFLFVTHDQEEAFSMADRVAVMNRGRIEQVGAPKTIYERPESLFVSDFVGISNKIPARVTNVTGDGSYAVQVATLGTVQAQGVSGLAVGDSVWLVVRPEVTELGDLADGGQGVRGTIRDVAYLGPQVVYRIATELAGEVHVVAPGQHLQHAAPGDPTTITWQHDAGWLLPAPPTASPYPRPGGSSVLDLRERP
jgi:ABC-type Fe3+/spermidine/putrescine transport system ATPase subunit